MQRADGFTPLHLVAARANVHDVHLGLIRLGEDTQVSFIFFVLAIFLNVSRIVINFFNHFKHLKIPPVFACIET